MTQKCPLPSALWVLLKLFHAENVMPSCTGSFARYTFSPKRSAECASGKTNHRRHCSPMWGLRITADNSGVLTFPDVWHTPPGWAGILFLSSDKNVTRAPRRRELLWQGFTIAKSPSPSPCPYCTLLGVFFGFMPILCSLISQEWARWATTCQSSHNRAGKIASRTPGICTKTKNVGTALDFWVVPTLNNYDQVNLPRIAQRLLCNHGKQNFNNVRH